MTGPFGAASHHDVLVLLVQIAVLLAVARAFGAIAQQLRQPSVVGEILAGILLGPSLLGAALPSLGAWIIPQTPVQGYLLETIALLGVMFLLLITGIETDLPLIRRHAKTAAGASMGGLILPFATGLLLGWYMPESLLAESHQRLVFALFVATAMSISAIPVIAKVLMDMDLMRRDIGQTIIAAGMTDDAVGWMLLSIVAGLAAGAGVTAHGVAMAVGKVALVMIFSFTLGRWMVKRAIDFVQDEVRARDRMLTLVVVLTMLWGALTQALGLEAALGAFLMGMLVGQMPRVPTEVVHSIESMGLAIFAPVFFAVAGLKVDVLNLLTPKLIGIALLVIAVATLGKVGGVYVGARIAGKRDHWTALSLGAGMNARGAMEIIVATIGLRLGILSQDMFSIIVLMAMVTSLVAPPTLRWALSHTTPEDQELDRLRKEELAAGSLIASVRRVLIPVRLRPESDPIHRVEAYIVRKMRERAPLSATLLTVSPPREREASDAFLKKLSGEFEPADVTTKVVEGREPGSAILDEAQKHYQLMLLGATDSAPGSGSLFHPMVDEMVRLAPCATLVIKGNGGGASWPPRRLLVPTNGSVASRHAADIASLLATEGNEEVIVLNVAEERGGLSGYGALAGSTAREMDARRRFVDELVERGQAYDVATRGLVTVGSDVDSVILEAAHRERIDLIVVGTDVRPGSDRLFLGPRVERILYGAPCPVIVINAG